MSFDPAAHLVKQGWKGKGTALRQGHATRPIAVVQKKTLAGIGKDRDEAVPFWDHIFASTASAILIPSLSPTPPISTGSSTPNANSRSADTPGATVAPTVRKLSLLAAAKKETARRGLYSRFSRGTTLSKEPTPVPETEVQFTVASTSSEPQVAASIASSSNSTDKKGKGKAVSETKGEKRARRAAKQARKEVKARRREDKAARQAVKSGEANQVFGDGDDSRTGDLRPETSTATEPAGPRQKSKRKRAGEDAGAKPTKHRRAAAELAT